VLVPGSFLNPDRVTIDAIGPATPRVTPWSPWPWKRSRWSPDPWPGPNMPIPNSHSHGLLPPARRLPSSAPAPVPSRRPPLATGQVKRCPILTNLW